MSSASATFDGFNDGLRALADRLRQLAAQALDLLKRAVGLGLSVLSEVFSLLVMILLLLVIF